MRPATKPYLWVTRSPRGGWSGWLEFPASLTDHAALVGVADRLVRDFGAVVVGRMPGEAADAGKEYWWLRVGPDTLMLMRKPPRIPVGLTVESGDFGLLLRIGRAWGVERVVGWRWRAWRAWCRATGRRVP